MFNLLSKLFSSSNNTQLQQQIKDGAFLVDVRTPFEFTSGSVKGAVNIPLETIPTQLQKFKNRKHIIVFCRSGNRSSQALAILNNNGITNVTNGGTWQHVNTLVNN